MRCIVRAFLVLAAGLAPAVSPAAAAPVAEQPHTRVELLVETREPAPGRPFTIGIALTPKPGWHTYWKNPGDSGIETRARWQAPPGTRVSPLRYPVPKPFLVAGIMNHVFEGEAVLLADVTLPKDVRGPFSLGARLDWLVCDDKLCVPEAATLDIPLRTGSGAADPAAAARLAAARAALPVRSAEPARFAHEGERLRLALPVAADGVRAAHFFPDVYGALDHAAPQRLGQTEGRLVLETRPASNAAPAAFSGVLRLELADGRILGVELAAREGPVPPARPLDEARRVPAFLPAFGLALLGGLLLNLMPCVFPILSLKAMSLARAGAGEAAARADGLAYTAGVLLATLALGGVAIALARAGQGAGWAFQLQDPRVILVLLLLTLAIGLNFAGLFEVGAKRLSTGQSLAARPGATGAFFTGALAAFVATPCTGPFMAGALGAALVLPPAAGLAVFAGLGLGLALPFLLLGFVPSLRRRMPRPGPWMEGFRRILAIPMLLTTVALAWVLGRQAGVDALAFGLLAALLVALGLWWLGLRQRRLTGARAPALAALAAALLAPLLLPRPHGSEAARARPAAVDAIAFSEAELARLRAAGKPVFLYFTADWCITCKVNEKAVLTDPEVREAFRRAGIRVMVADWTRPDPVIARFLEARGRAGIPLYLFYGADGRVTELPQLLTPAMLTALASSRSSTLS
ncbi:protein-disulfide reductase DsbD family protein [Thermaurantiacus sp.]